MRCLVGLGNPGVEYRNTFHNVGFAAIDAFARSLNLEQPSIKFDAEFHKENYGSFSYLILKPQTYMNLSGKSLLACKQFYKLQSSDFLVVCDDLNLPFGTLRYREKGSDGGHNGLKDIIRLFGVDEFPRIKIGIGRPQNKNMVKSYVLSRIMETLQTNLDEIYAHLVEVMIDFICEKNIQLKSNLSKQA